MSTLYYGDNLAVLRDQIARECVDLIYLDPPFNSQANYNVAMVRDLAHVVDREKARIAVFITLAESTPMRTEAVKAGYYERVYGKYPKIQILTIADLFSGKQPNIPWVDPSAFKKAAKESEGGDRDKLPF